MKRRPSVALLIETSNAYARGLLQGIVAYHQERPKWSIHLPEQGRGEAPPAWLRRWRGDGIIARIENVRISKAVLATGLPVVDVSAARHIPNIPWLETDNAAIAALVADHLIDRGFQNLAFCGDARFNWSNWRRDEFLVYTAAKGLPCAVYESPAGGAERSWDREQAELVRWVRKLPKPIGVLACYDIKAQQLLDACREAGVAVPEDVAVIGVDNDELLCNLCTPPLSSVILNPRRTGYEAAALLDQMMQGRRASSAARLIPPAGIAVRQSTDTVAIDDRDVAAAMRFIREHALEGINVKSVLQAAPISRRVLERRFQQLFGRTPHDEIVRLRIEHVKRLLVETDLPLARISIHAGFDYQESMSLVFKKATGLPPREYRRRFGPGGQDAGGKKR